MLSLDTRTRIRKGPPEEAKLERCYLHLLGDAEAAKLSELRALVPSALARVREDSAAAKACERLKIWGVDAELGSAARDIVLLKFLRAEELDVEKAAARFARTLRYRCDEHIEGLATAELPEHFRGHDTVAGHDVDGRPVMISRYGQMDNEKVFGDPDAFVRYRVQVMERAIAMLSFEAGAAEDLCQIHDYSGVDSIFKTSEVKDGIAAMSKVFSEHFPETKGKTVFVNFPSVFSRIFQAFSFFIPEKTRRKFVILGDADQAALFNHISPELVSDSLGGMLTDAPGQLTGPCNRVPVPNRGTAEVTLQEFDGPSKVEWELRVCAKEVDCEVAFVPASGGPEEVVQRQQLTAAEGVITAKFDAREAGALKCRFRHEGGFMKGDRLCLCRAARLG